MGLTIKQLSKSFGLERVLQDISFELSFNQTLSVLGKSGSGKSTLLKILAGLENGDSGEIFLDGLPLHRLPAHERGIVYIHQEPLLFPHMTVFENLAFGLRLRKRPKSEILLRTEALLHSLELVPHAYKMPNQLSGGQKQRVNFGRALMVNPKVLLLDEPFGKLDSETRQQMQSLFLDLQATYAVTAIFVTHELKEALKMGIQWAYMSEGRLKIYPDIEAFIQDPRTGILSELNFWQSFNKQSNEKRF